MNLSQLMKENVLEVSTVDYAASKRILDEEGNPLKWKIKPLTNAEVDAITAKHTRRTINPRTGQANEITDMNGILDEIVLESLVEPSRKDFENGALQDSWGVFTPIGVIKAMLNPGEYAELAKTVQELAGYEALAFKDMVDEFKKN